jgi:hypothetical protein
VVETGGVDLTMRKGKEEQERGTRGVVRESERERERERERESEVI